MSYFHVMIQQNVLQHDLLNDSLLGIKVHLITYRATYGKDLIESLGEHSYEVHVLLDSTGTGSKSNDSETLKTDANHEWHRCKFRNR